MNNGIEVRLLGPLEVVVPDGPVEFEGAKQRRLFVALALRAPEAVPVDELVEAVWGDQAPEGRDQALQKQVSRLRARVGDQLPVRRRTAGYALEIDRQAIDTRQFEKLLERSRGRRGRRADRRARAVARAGARRASLRRVRPGRDRPPRGPAHGGDRGARRGRPRARAGRRPRRRAAHPRRRAPAARAPARAADARALPVRPAGRRAGGHARGPAAAGRRARARARPGAAQARADDPRPGSGAGGRVAAGRAERAVADPGQRDDRPRGRAGRDRGDAGPPRSSASDTCRHRRRRQDEVGAGGLAGDRRPLPGRRRVRRPRGRRGRAGHRRGRRAGRRGRHPGGARRASRPRDPRGALAARPRPRRALPRRRRSDLPAAGGGAQPHGAGHEPRAAAADRRADLPRPAARGHQRRRAVHLPRRRGAA